MRNRRSQIKMGETIAIMFVFFIILIVGAVFYMNLQRTSVRQEIAEAYELRAVELAQTISFLPEAQCTESNVVRASCFDIYKLIGLSKVTATPKGLNVYQNDFGTTTIKLIQIYPEGGEWVLYDNPKADFTSAPVTHIPISLYNTTSDIYYFGVLEVTTYS
ncbi:hypothetical protein KY349_00355 [Candidatus Woesearchaeota archaeon]|jgi:hypothetical protein|nr:hypothetical protein [Candidatus Woesearchaeota archaeon]